MKRVQEWLGHAHFQTTANFYSHLDTTSKLETANAFANNMQLDKIITPEIPILLGKEDNRKQNKKETSA